MKQRFGEVLALVLIVSIVGFIVYMMVPSSPRTPKPEPVTVRSTAKIEAQSHITPVASVADQTPPSSTVLQETTARNVSQNSTNSSIQRVNGNPSLSKMTSSTKRASEQVSSRPTTFTAAITKSDCTPLPKTVVKIGSALQSIPIISGLISDANSCAT